MLLFLSGDIQAFVFRVVFRLCSMILLNKETAMKSYFQQKILDFVHILIAQITEPQSSQHSVQRLITDFTVSGYKKTVKVFPGLLGQV